MPIKRTYGDHGDACRAANALDMVGDRWTLIVVRELILGPKRFADLQLAVLGITPAVLSDRLRALSHAGIIEQTATQDGTNLYIITEWGRGLEDVLTALGRWYSTGPDPRTKGGMTPDAVVLAMRTMAPATAEPIPDVSLRLYDARDHASAARGFVVKITDDLEIGVDASEESSASVVTADSTIWSDVLFGDVPLERAEHVGKVQLDGDRDAVVQLVDLFSNRHSDGGPN